MRNGEEKAGETKTKGRVAQKDQKSDLKKLGRQTERKNRDQEHETVGITRTGGNYGRQRGGEAAHTELWA